MMLDDFRDDPIVLLMSAELILKHGEWPFARELFDLGIRQMGPTVAFNR